MVPCSTITTLGDGLCWAAAVEEEWWHLSPSLCSTATGQDGAAVAAASLLQSKERLSLVQLVRGGRMFLCPAHCWVAVPLVLIGFAAR